LASGCRRSDPFLERVHAAGVLRVGLDPSWPPFEYVDDEGQIVGLDVDLARAIGRELGVEVHLVPSGWEGLYGALFAGQFDAIISALPYDPWRTEEAAYSISYFNAGPVIVVGSGVSDLAGVEDLLRAGGETTVHVEFGSEGDVQARRLQKRNADLQIVTHDTAQEALGAASAGAAIVDAVTAHLAIRDGAPLQIVGEPLYDEAYVVAVHPSAESLREAIDRALLDMRESGELQTLIERWL
jgi:polar amino acid transport system substrate-binding protein